MSKLTELLDELCPDGVQNARFSEVCEYVRGVTYKKDQELPADSALGFKLLRANNITVGANVLNFDEVKVVSPDVKVSERQKLSAGDILICAGSGSKQHIGKVAYIESDMPYTFGGFMAVIRTNGNVDSRYLFHVLTGDMFKNYLQVALTSTTINNLNQRIMGNFAFPVPPLEVQQEIVRVLDAFTDLEQSLVSELELRKKQFDSVRRSVISDSQAAEKKVLRLREAESEGIVTLGRGKVISKKDIAANPGDYPVYSSSGAGNGEFGRYGNYMFDDERISWSVDGGGRLFYRPTHRYSVTNVSGWMTVNTSDLQVKYLYYVLLSQWENERFDYTRKAHPSVIREVYEFSIPPIEIQDEVVSKLDTYESLIQSIEQEISLRRKQYEFYRDELLSFAPKED